MNKVPHKVFICYASEDKAIAEAACDALESRGMKCWIAPRDVLPGMEWAETIVDAIDESQTIVLILSSSSNNSPQVIREIGRAAGKGIPIIPLVIDDVSLSKSMDYFISRHQFMDATTPPLEKHLQRLTDTMETILARRGSPQVIAEEIEAEERAKREAEEKAKREAEEKVRKEAEERAKKEAEEKAKREAEEARKAREAEEKAKRKAEKEAKEREKREAKERLAEPVKAKIPLLKRWWLWTGSGAVAIAVVLILLFVLAPWENGGKPVVTIPEDTEEPPPTGTGAPPETTTEPTTQPTTKTKTPSPVTTTGAAAGGEILPKEPYGTITAAVADFGSESTDPVNSESLWGWMYYDPLIRWDEDGNFMPWIAQSWTIDGNVYTFHIRQGITFHNGDPLTARDVKFSVDRFGNTSFSSNPWSYFISEAYNKIESSVIDDYTFRFIADHPEPAQLIALAWTRILPKDYYEEVGIDEFRAHPIGSGPWKFVELVPDTRLKLEANTEYFFPEMVPEYQYYVELEVPEQAQRLNMLQAGEIDIALGIDYDRISTTLNQGFAAIKLGSSGTSSVSIQGSWLPEAGPVHDIRVREAMSWALDRQEIADTWYQGFAYPGGNFYMTPGCFGWSDDLLDGFEFDKQKALELLAEAGYSHGLALHMYATADQQDYMLLLISYWHDVGIDVQLEVADNTIWASYFFNLERLQADSPNVGWIFAWTYQGFFNSIYHCSNMYTSWGGHNVGNDPTADELYLKAANEVDPDLSYQYFNDLQKYVKAQYWNIGIVIFERLTLYNPETIGEWSGMNWVSYQDALYGLKHPE